MILYYFYEEISNFKKLFIPTYQKLMSLETRLMQLEKKMDELFSQHKIQKEDSSPLSITYRSDMINNNNLSVKYTGISESDKINPICSGQDNIPNVTQLGGSPCTIKNTAPNDSGNEYCTNKYGADCQKTLDRQNTTSFARIYSDDTFDDEIDSEIVKNISESLRYVDLTSEQILSEIPPTPKFSNKKDVASTSPKETIKKDTSSTLPKETIKKGTKKSSKKK
ncbi:MAG: hypothetical protein QXW79_01210 [Thermoplasmata archaeon]